MNSRIGYGRKWGEGGRKVKGVRQSSRQSWLPTPMFKKIKNNYNTLHCTMYRYLSKCVNTIMMNYALNVEKVIIK